MKFKYDEAHRGVKRVKRFWLKTGISFNVSESSPLGSELILLHDNLQHKSIYKVGVLHYNNYMYCRLYTKKE